MSDDGLFSTVVLALGCVILQGFQGLEGILG